MKMTREDTEWQTLNAYVDGELSAADMDTFKQHIAKEPRLQMDVEAVLDLKRALTRMRPSVAEARRPAPARPARRRLYYAAVAATFVGFAVAAVAAMLPAPAETTWFEDAKALHAELARQAYVVEERYVVQTISSGHALAFRPPDLTASRLYLVDIANSDSDSGETISMHYRGLNGCRLTIVAIETGGEQLASPAELGALTRIWHRDGFAFAVIANDMDAQRFSAVADYAEAAIGVPSVDDRRQRIAMAETLSTARSCA
jgi:anti-sigma factor RsiW